MDNLSKNINNNLIINNKAQIYNLGDLVNFIGGKAKYSYDYVKNNKGIYPVFSKKILNDGIMGHIDTYDYNGTYVYCTTVGEAGTIFFKKNMKFSLSQNVYILEPKDKSKLNLKYLYYYLKANQIYIYIV